MPLFVTLAQHPAGPRIYQVDPLARDASEGFIAVTFGRIFLRNEALNARCARGLTRGDSA